MKTKTISILFLCIFSLSIAYAEDSQTITFGFLPIFSPETLVKLHYAKVEYSRPRKIMNAKHIGKKETDKR